MTPVIVIFQGAQSVGKTTLANKVYQYLSSYLEIDYYEEVARSLIKEGVSHDVETKEMDYFAYYYAHLKNFNHLSSCESDVVLFDRSYIDVITYSRLVYGEKNWIEKLGFELMEGIKKHNYIILYLPIEFPIVADGIRNADDSNRSQYDQTMLQVIKELNLPFETITGCIDTRLRATQSIIKSALTNQ